VLLPYCSFSRRPFSEVAAACRTCSYYYRSSFAYRSSAGIATAIDNTGSFVVNSTAAVAQPSPIPVGSPPPPFFAAKTQLPEVFLSARMRRQRRRRQQQFLQQDENAGPFSSSIVPAVSGKFVPGTFLEASTPSSRRRRRRFAAVVQEDRFPPPLLVAQLFLLLLRSVLRSVAGEHLLDDDDINSNNQRDDEPVSRDDETASDDVENDKETMTAAMVASIGVYKQYISPLLPPACRFVPTCSQYGVQAIEKYGPAKGAILTAWRILRCSPIGGKGYDPPKWPPVPYWYSSY